MTVKRHKHKRLSNLFLRMQPLTQLATGEPKAINRKIVAAGRVGDTEYYLHATKGYRSHHA